MLYTGVWLEIGETGDSSGYMLRPWPPSLLSKFIVIIRWQWASASGVVDSDPSTATNGRELSNPEINCRLALNSGIEAASPHKVDSRHSIISGTSGTIRRISVSLWSLVVSLVVTNFRSRPESIQDERRCGRVRLRLAVEHVVRKTHEMHC